MLTAVPDGCPGHRAKVTKGPSPGFVRGVLTGRPPVAAA